VSHRIRICFVVPLLTLLACSGEAQRYQPPPTHAVRSEVVMPGEFRGVVRVLGVVRPQATVDLLTSFSGPLHYSGRFRDGLRTGVAVEQGDVVGTVENAAVRLRLDEANLEQEAASAELERVRRAVAAGIVPQTDLNHAELRARLARRRLAAAEIESSRLNIVAPRAGRLIVEKSIPAGSEVAAGVSLAQIAAEGTPLVEGWAGAAMQGRLEPGLEVRCVDDSGAGTGCSGIVREVAPVVDRAGTVRVIAEMFGEEGLPAPGEGVEIEVLLTPQTGRLTVPESALVIAAGGTSLFVLEPRGDVYVANRVPVEVGERAHRRVVILQGLTEGQRIAVAGTSLLTDGARAFEAKPRKATGEEGAS